jgi:hypothetical protein
MAKVYDYTRFKILREIRDLEEFVRQKYESSKNASEFVWFDHYSVAHARARVEQLRKQLEELDDSPFSQE